jgi:vacuolar protein-sorting-associated protein 4
MYGPPGTGKTFLAKACATEANSTFFSVSSADLTSKYVGETEKLIKALFTRARECKPAVIFIDEIDSMCGNRTEGDGDASRRAKTEFLVQMQGVGHDETGVLVLGATNLPWALDPAIRRRFERRIYISLPDYAARLGMLKGSMRIDSHELSDPDFEEFATRTENYSGSDIITLIKDAVYEPVRRLQTARKFRQVGAGKWTPCREGEEGENKTWMDFKQQSELDIGKVSREDFLVALKRTRPSVDATQLSNYEQFTTTFGQDG